MALDVTDPSKAIEGTPPAAINPLAIMSGYADFANKLQQNRNMQQELANLQLTNQTGQQALAQKMQIRNNQLMVGVLAQPDDQLVPAAQRTLDDELASGQVDQQRYDVMNKALKDNANNPAQIRTMIHQALISNMTPAEQATFLTPQIKAEDIGGQNIYNVNPSGLNLLQGRPGVGIAGAGAVNRTLAPGLQDVGGTIQPYGGALGSPTFTKGFTPIQSVELQQQLVKNPDGSYSLNTQPLGQKYPTAVAPLVKPSLGPGSYPKTSNVPLGTQQQLESDQTAFQADKNAAPGLQTGVQSLNKALDALNMVATGAGTGGLARMRAYAVSLGNVVGIPTGGVNVQDMNRAELEKYLTDYARASGTAGRSDEALTAAFKSNASGQINNAAAQDVVRTNIGRDRQKVATTMTQENPQGSGYTSHKTDFSNTTDPRGFAWDTYTDAQKAAIVKETQGKQGEDSPAYKKLARSVGVAQRLGLLNLNRELPQNVNAAPNQ